MVSFGSLNVNSGSSFIFLEELNLDNSLAIKSFDFVTLLRAFDRIRLNSDSNVLCLISLSIIIHYIVSVIFTLGDCPLFRKFINLNVFLNVVKDGAWLDGIKVDVNRENVIKGLVGKSSLSY